jgi:hypothetical protein
LRGATRRNLDRGWHIGEAIIERIEEAKRGAGAAPEGLDESMLERGDQTLTEWVTALRGLHARSQSFRLPALTLDALWKVLEDVARAPLVRAAAAIALSPYVDDRGRDRLRGVARASVTPDLVAVLEAAADDEAEAITEGLGQLAAATEAQTTDRPPDTAGT